MADLQKSVAPSTWPFLFSGRASQLKTLTSMSHLVIKSLRPILTSAILAAPAFAQDINTPAIDAVVITGRAENLVGRAASANESYIGAVDLARRPLSRVGEVVETIPGVIVSQHSDGGKANQFYLRSSISITAPTSRQASMGCRSTCRSTRTARATRI